VSFKDLEVKIAKGKIDNEEIAGLSFMSPRKKSSKAPTKIRRKAIKKVMSAKKRQKPQINTESPNNKRKPSELTLSKIQPLTDSQDRAFEAYDEGKNLLLHGYAGTGKTFIALYLAFDEILSTGHYNLVQIVRSAVPSRDQGFLKGDIDEKSAIFEEPYRQLVNQLFNRGDAYDIYKHKQMLEFTTTSYLRGTTFNNCIVILDECQNLTKHEFNTIMTRIGDNCRIIVCGDIHQSDLTEDGQNDRIISSLTTLKSLPSVVDIEFGVEDVVRSGFAKEWILATFGKK